MDCPEFLVRGGVVLLIEGGGYPYLTWIPGGGVLIFCKDVQGGGGYPFCTHKKKNKKNKTK